MPDLDPGEHMLQAFLDMGPVMHLPDGDAPVTWVEASAFATATLAVSDPWEIRTLVQMSRAFAFTREAAKDPLYLSPIEQGHEQDD
jgi:hypothetical protein